MHIQIRDKSCSIKRLKCGGNCGAKELFIATVGEAANRYLLGQTFSLSDIACVAPITIVNIPCFSDYSWLKDDEKQKRFGEDMRDISEACTEKRLFVLSEIDDLAAAGQCCELAKNTGQDGCSVLITHQKSKNLGCFLQLRSAFDHIILIPDHTVYQAEILKWIICDFNSPGYIGVDIEDVYNVLTNSLESHCIKFVYSDIGGTKKQFIEDLNQFYALYNSDCEIAACLLGLRVPMSVGLEEIEYVAEEVIQKLRSNVVITCVPNESKKDESWTIFLLMAD